jgi:hypothetical protein
MFGSMALHAFSEIWGTDNKEGAKYKVGELVVVEISPHPDWEGFVAPVVAMNHASEEDGFEYLLEGFPYMIWESNIRAHEQKGG